MATNAVSLSEVHSTDHILEVITRCESELATNFALTSRAIIAHHAAQLEMSPASFRNLLLQQAERMRADIRRLNPLPNEARR